MISTKWVPGIPGIYRVCVLWGVALVHVRSFGTQSLASSSLCVRLWCIKLQVLGYSSQIKDMTMAGSNSETFLFTSESVGEGHPGELILQASWVCRCKNRLSGASYVTVKLSKA